MNVIYSILPVIALIILGLVQGAFGQTAQAGNPPPPPPDFHGGPPHGFADRFALDKLGLNDAQRQQIDVLEANSRELTADDQKAVRSADDQLRLMVDSGTFSDESAMRLIRVKTDAMSKIELVRLRTDAAIAKVLTADQKAQLARLRTERRPPPPPGMGMRPDGQ